MRQALALLRQERRPLADRLWEHVDKSGGQEACWPYTRITHDNYGGLVHYLEDGTKISIGTHRAAYLVTYGILSDTHMVLHTCGNKRCCNPLHLYLGTASENAHDAINDGAWEPSKRKLSDEDIREIRARHGEFSQKALATQFCISLSTVSAILSGKERLAAGGPLRIGQGRTKTHCHKGHELTEDNIVLSHNDTARNCKICYLERNRLKANRRLALHRDDINAQRRARHGSTVKRLTSEDVMQIQSLHPAHSYRDLAAMFDVSYSVIQRVIHGTYVISPHA